MSITQSTAHVPYSGALHINHTVVSSFSSLPCVTLRHCKKIYNTSGACCVLQLNVFRKAHFLKTHAWGWLEDDWPTRSRSHSWSWRLVTYCAHNNEAHNGLPVFNQKHSCSVKLARPLRVGATALASESEQTDLLEPGPWDEACIARSGFLGQALLQALTAGKQAPEI